MTAKSDFTDEEWELVAEGPALAGVIAATAQRGGSFRESYALAKTYAEARQRHGESELLDQIVSAKPEFDRKKYHSPEELHDKGLQQIQQATELVESKATPEEVDSYRSFALDVAKNVAARAQGGRRARQPGRGGRDRRRQREPRDDRLRLT